MPGKPVVSALVVALCVSACAIIDPQLKQQDFSAPIGSSVAYSNALMRADVLEQELRDKIETHQRLEFVLGTGLYLSGMATLALGVFDAPRIALLTAGVATAGFASLREFFPWRERRTVWSDARGTLACAVSVTSFGAPQPPPAPKGDDASGAGKSTISLAGTREAPSIQLQPPTARPLAGLPASIDALVATVAPLPGPAPAGANEVSAPSPLSTVQLLVRSAGTEAAQAARELDARLVPGDANANQLNATVDAIRVIVDRRIDALQLNPQAGLPQVRADLISQLQGTRELAVRTDEELRRLDERIKLAQEMQSTTASPAEISTKKAAVDGIRTEVRQIIAAIRIPDTCLGSLGSW